MAKLKEISKAIRDANNARDRCECGHKKVMHKWPYGIDNCKVAHCDCHEYREVTK